MIRKFFRSLEDLFFPPLCFHCDEDVCEEGTPFCKNCSELFEPLDPSERCSRCLQPLSHHSSHCPSFTKPYFQVYGSFENWGPPAVLLKLHQSQLFPKTASLIACFMLIEIERRKLPLPELLTWPQTPWKGVLPSPDKEIAEALSHLLKIPLAEGPTTGKTVGVVTGSIEDEKCLSFGKKLLEENPKRLILMSYIC